MTNYLFLLREKSLNMYLKYTITLPVTETFKDNLLFKNVGQVYADTRIESKSKSHISFNIAGVKPKVQNGPLLSSLHSDYFSVT